MREFVRWTSVASGKLGRPITTDNLLLLKKLLGLVGAINADWGCERFW